jgi:phytanoyl-CoA hydroxylase
MNYRDQQQVLTNFQQDGYAQLPAFLDNSTIKEVEQQLQRFIATTVPSLPTDQVFFENKQDQNTLKQIQHLELHDNWFHKLFTDSPFRQLAETLLGGGCVPMNLQYFNKPPKASKPTPPHQDGYYFMITPCEAVTMWLALDNVDEENGCIRYLGGSHRLGLLPHARTKTLGFSQGIDDYFRHCDTRSEEPIHASAGDLLAHHAMTVHRADANESSTRQRRAIGFIYYSTKAKQDIAAHSAYQERLKREMTDSNRI